MSNNRLSKDFAQGLGSFELFSIYVYKPMLKNNVILHQNFFSGLKTSWVPDVQLFKEGKITWYAKSQITTIFSNDVTILHGFLKVWFTYA